MAISTHVYGSEMIGENMEPKQDDMLHSRLYAILEQSLNEIYVFDTQTLRFSYVNRFAQRNLGYSADELAEMTPLQITPEFDEVFFRGMADSLLKGQNENLVFETQHLRANGTLYPVEVHLQRFAQPGREEFLAIVLDITTRRLAEAALRDSEMRFRTMANTIPQLAWIAKTDGSRSWYNQRWYDYTGTNRGEALGWGWQKFHDPEVLPQVIRRWTEAVSAGQAFDMEFPLRRSDGNFRIFLTRAEPLRDAEGRIVQWFGTNTDVHEQRLEERARRETEQKLQAVMENISEGLVMCDASGQLLYWNPAARRMHEIGDDEMQLDLHTLSRTFEMASLDDGPLPAGRWPLSRVLQGERLQDVEVRVRRLDREWERIFNYSGVLSRYESGKEVAFLTIRDITERKRAEEELRDAKMNLESKVEARTAQLVAKSKELESFCYSVSHDLRAPLRGIDGYSRLLLESYHDSLDEEGRSFLKNVRAATTHMSRLIEDLLAYSRLERRKLSAVPVELSTFIAALLSQIPDRTKKIHLIVQVGSHQVMGDPEGLAIVLRNLIDNAIKFSQHAPAQTIEIVAEAEEGHCLISVRDNGIGFDMRFSDKIFEIFQRLNRVEDYPGTGIGLAMAHKATERMGGHIWAKSAPGEGAIFYLRLPLADKDRRKDAGDLAVQRLDFNL
jgi:PAS domain S-box-containing protein